MATTNQNWMGINIDFSTAEDKTSVGNGFELLEEGFYKAEIKNVVKGVLGANDRPALIINLELEDNKKEMTCNLFLPQNGDSENAIKFKKEVLRNFFTRTVFNKLTEAEYKELSADEVNSALLEAQTDKKAEKQFIGKKVLVHIKQEPFIAQEGKGGAIKFTDKKVANVLNNAPIQVVKLISEKEKSGVDMTYFPVILFSNKVAPHGFGFYNDYNNDVVLKNSKAYDFVQSLNQVASTSAPQADELIGEDEIPF